MELIINTTNNRLENNFKFFVFIPTNSFDEKRFVERYDLNNSH